MGDFGDPPINRDRSVVGREAEQRRIDRFLADMSHGARSLVVQGDAGVGKTTLWRWAIEQADLLGYQILMSRAAEDEMPLAFATLADLFDNAEDTVNILAPETGQMARGRAVLDAIRGLAAGHPTLLAIDDVQWIDSGSARTLRFAIRRLDGESIGLICTARAGTEPHDPMALSSTLPPGRSEALDLRPLGLEATRQLLTTVVSSVSRPTLKRIHQVSGGNPLYAIELARYLANHEITPTSAAVPLPDSLQFVIAQRLDLVPLELTSLLEMLSLLGRASLARLGELLPDADLDRLVAIAREAHLIVAEGDFEVRFSHPLIASVVHARMNPLARRELHVLLVERTNDPDLKARYLALSTDDRNEQVASLLEQASIRAADRGAADSAAEFAGHSARLTPLENEEGARRRLMAEIEHLAAAGAVGRALALADQLVESLPAGSARAEALVQRYELTDDDASSEHELLLRALADVGDDARLKARIMMAIAHHRHTYLGDATGAVEMGREALAVVVAVGDPALEMSALGRLARFESAAGTPRPDLMDRALLLEDELAMPLLYQSPRELFAGQLLWAGDLGGARAMLEEVRTRALQAGIEWKDLQHYYSLALLEAMAGNLVAAEDAVLKAVEAARDAEDPLSERTLLYPLALVHCWRGRAAEARAEAATLVDESAEFGSPAGVMRGRGVLGLVSLSQGDPRAAAQELTAAAELSDEMGLGHPGADRVLPDAVEALSLAGDLKSAAIHLERLERQADNVDCPWPNAARTRARGASLLSRGETEEALPLFSDAVEQFDEIGCRPDAARARLLEGRALLRVGLRSRSVEVLADAHERFAAMGATLWQARAAEELERAAPGRTSGELTGTERRIAELVAHGQKNREISEDLFISVATVEAHLTRMYRKLNIRSRTELARLVTDGSVSASVNRGLGSPGVDPTDM